MLSFQTIEPHALELLRSLMEILGFYQEKYPEHSLFRALMSLSYFDDAEKQMMPKMFASVSWDEMKAYIIKEVEKIN